MTWREVSLREICDVDWGNTKLTKSSYISDGKYLAVSAAGADGLIDHYEHEANVPVLSAIGAQCGRMFYPGARFTAIKNTITLTPKSELVDGKFLYYLFTYVELPQRGAGQPFISKGDIETFRVPIPVSLEKQREIVENLDTAFADIDLLENNLELSDEKANQLLQSLLSASFSLREEQSEPSNSITDQRPLFRTVRLKEVATIEKNQGSFNSAYVGLEDIESNSGLHLGSREPRTVKSNTYSFTSGHLLYGRLRPYLNKVLLPSFDGHCSTEIFPIKPSKEISREYLAYWFRQPKTVESIDQTSTGARMPRANMDAVMEFEIPLPSLEKQRESVEKLDRAFAEIESFRAKIKVEKELVAALRQSLLSSAFSQEEAVA